MKNNIKKIINIIAVTLFLSVLFAFLILTFQQKHAEIENSIKSQKEAGTLSVNSVDSVLKEQLYGKDTMIEVSGATKLLLGKRLSDDGQYFRGKHGMIHLNYGWRDYNRMLNDLNYLSGYLSHKNTPLLICQVAERAQYPNGFSYLFSGNSLDYILPLKQIAEENGDLYFDYSDYFATIGFDENDIFFKTDLHYTTEAEFAAFVAVMEKLYSEKGMVFKNADCVSSIENYAVEKNIFLGNLGRTTGSLYSFGVDKFAHFVPKFNTNMTLINSNGAVLKSGTFEQVVMNGYRANEETDQYTYWVTDFLQFTNPYYTIVNNLVEENDILVISDSMAFRTISYLSLACHSVTVLDPRYFSNTDYLGMALENDYDAVICFASGNMNQGIGGYAATTESTSYATDTIDASKTVSVVIKNTGTRVWTEQGIYVCALIYDNDYGIRIGLPEGTRVNPGESYKFVFQESDFSVLFDSNYEIRYVMYDSYGNIYFGN